MILSLTQGFIFLLYVTFLFIKFRGPLPSISDSWYELKDLGGVWYSLFTWFCLLLGVTMFFQTDGSTPLFFLSGSGITIVGVATMFKSNDDIAGWLHPLAAIVGILSALAGIAMERELYWPAILFCVMAGTIKLLKITNDTWWIEIIAFCCIFASLLIN